MEKEEKMDFLYLFGLVNFDAYGNLAADGEDENISRSNYLYLLSKYNQTVLQEENLPVSDFFKSELQSILQSVEAGGDFEQAKKKILSNCHLRVQRANLSSRNDKELISRLNETISARDEAFAKFVGKNINHLQLAYIITSLSGRVEKKIEELLQAGFNGKSEKSKAYKEMIKYNRLMLTAEKVAAGEVTAKDLMPVVA